MLAEINIKCYILCYLLKNSFLSEFISRQVYQITQCEIRLHKFVPNSIEILYIDCDLMIKCMQGTTALTTYLILGVGFHDRYLK